MKAKKEFNVLIFITFFYGCDTSFLENFFGKNEELSFIRKDYQGYELKTDGYYYFERKNNDTTFYYNFYFLYKNGIALCCGYYSENILLTKEEEFINGKFKRKYLGKSASYWGLFLIDKAAIQIEQLYYGPFRAYINSGNILNDTTFTLIKRKSSYSSEETEILETYHFKKFNYKPDSTNVFIK